MHPLRSHDQSRLGFEMPVWRERQPEGIEIVGAAHAIRFTLPRAKEKAPARMPGLKAERGLVIIVVVPKAGAHLLHIVGAGIALT